MTPDLNHHQFIYELMLHTEGNMKYTVEYNPDLTTKGAKLIRENITPSLSSPESGVYDLGFTLETLADRLSKKDFLNLKQFQEEGIHYIEL